MASEEELAERLIERLLSDRTFRAEFRRDPVAVARGAGLTGVAGDLLTAGGDPLQTLDLRESRSSLAGVMMAAAAEGIALYELGSGFAHPADASAHEVARVAEDRRVDPTQYGMEGSGGAPSPEVRALLDNHRVTLDATGIADLRAGRIDPRIVSVLTALSHKHTITISAMSSDHPKLTTGGSVSNHYVGRAVDIATVDGQPVGPGNAAARELATALARLDPSIRPTEIGSPWQLSGPAYFSDAAHQNHVHVGFDDPVPTSWRPPEGGQAPDPPERAPAQPGAVPPPDDDQADDDATDVREDGGSGDTEAEADDDEDDDEDEDEDDEDEDEDDYEDEDEEDEDERDEQGPDQDDLTDDEVVESGSSGDEAALDSGQSENRGAGSPDEWQAPAIEAGEDPGDGASKEQFAAWMAGQARRRGIPPELPIMASLVESGLRNLNFGDADSVGFFQMRVGIWNQGDYAGYPDAPEKQLDWFLDHAVAVKQQRLGRGLPVDDSSQYGEWIADVERPAEQFRWRYQPRLAEARELLEHAGRALEHRESRGDPGDVQKLSVIDPDEARRAKEGSGW
jgi:hypothetical protein